MNKESNVNSVVHSTDEATLYDIEPPVPPDIDWLSVLQTSADWLVIIVLFIGLVALLLMFKSRHQPFAKQGLWLHFVFAKRQLSKLQKSLQSSAEQTVSQDEIAGFYHLVQRLRYMSQKLKVEDQQAVELLQRHADELAFSTKLVSRETLAMNLQKIEQYLQQNISSKTVLFYIVNRVLTFKKTPFEDKV
ncbi:MAG: hypothetical protein R3254_00925 [Thiomicrorhabdus sp.]|nr:hypothetical protein [Thiomicrorhabdus sp.]